MKILAIETSCDETAISILEIKKTANIKYRVFDILSNIVASQVKIHAKWGGVVPNLAKREHQANLIPVLKQALKEVKILKQITNYKSKITNQKLQTIKKILEREPELLKNILPFLKKYGVPKVDLIAVTQGPGLEPALWVGINLAETLSYFWQKPLIGINHLEGHIFSVFFQENREISKSKSQIPKIKFPALALLVSGGHTELVLMRKWLDYKVIGQTLDDAAGEAFDKVAKMLGLGYPGGPVISKMAEIPRNVRNSVSNIIKLPRPMINSKDYNFSFSGLKTAVLYLLRDLEKQVPDLYKQKGLIAGICAEFQKAVIDVLLKKTMAAAEQYKVKTIILGGGVAANKELRRQLEKAIEEINFENCRRGRAPERSEGRDKQFSKFSFRNKLALLMPEMGFTGDNAAMIALPAYFRWQKSKKPADLRALKADSNLKLD